MANLYSTAVLNCRLPAPGTPMTKLVLLTLAWHADETGRCRPSVELICDETGMAKSTVLLHMNYLESAGLVRRQPGHTGRCTAYLLALAAINALIAAKKQRPAAGPVRREKVQQVDSSIKDTSNPWTYEVQPMDLTGPTVGHQRSWKGHRKVKGDGDGLDLPFSDPEFVSAWNDWTTHRRELGAKGQLTGTAARLQLAQLKKMGLSRAIAALQHSTQKGWTGIYEPKPETTTPKRNGYASIL